MVSIDFSKAAASHDEVLYPVDIMVSSLLPEHATLLHFGMSAKVEIKQPVYGKYMVPINAVNIDGQVAWVLKREANGNYNRVDVTLGKTSITEVMVLAGVSSGDRIKLNDRAN